MSSSPSSTSPQVPPLWRAFGTWTCTNWVCMFSWRTYIVEGDKSELEAEAEGEPVEPAGSVDDMQGGPAAGAGATPSPVPVDIKPPEAT